MNLVKSTDKPELIVKIKALQSEYKDVFNQLKWCLNSVYTIDYKAMLCMEDIDETNLPDFVEDVHIELIRILCKHDVAKDKSYGLRTFTVKPKHLCIRDDMSIREFTETNFLPNKCDISFVHTLSYMEADDICEQLSIMLENRSISNERIKREFSILSKFIEEVRESIKSFNDFSKEFDEINYIENDPLSEY